MRPVNLLPAKHRPRSAGGDSKASYVSLGVLGALVLAVLMYVMSANQVSTRNAEIADTRARIQAAESQMVTLQSFGDFAGTKTARVEAVKSLATARLDWERLFRELAHVLPERVWLTNFDGNAIAGEATGTGSTAPAGPTLALQGCAASHSSVADVMVRLRELHGAEDVTLAESAKADEAGSEAGAAAAPAPDGSASAGSACGPYANFKIDVLLRAAGQESPPAAGQAPAQVPARLGGGE